MVNKVTIDEAVCKGCALCTMACPKKVLKLDMGRLNIRGYHPSTVASPEKCVACAMCAMMCPDSAITVEKEAN